MRQTKNPNQMVRIFSCAWSTTGNIRTENLLDILQRKSSLYETMEKAQNEKDIATLMEQTAKQIITSGHSEIHNKAHRQHDELQ